jgi:hypothetical protein
MRLDFDAFQYDVMPERASAPAQMPDPSNFDYPLLSSDVPLPEPRCSFISKSSSGSKSKLPIEPSVEPEEADEADVELGLDARQMKAIRLLVAGNNKTTVAKAINATTRSLGNWFKLPQFKACLKDRIKYANQESSVLARANATNAVEQLVRVMTKPGHPQVDGAVVKACTAILRYADESYFSEQVVERVDKLEQAKLEPAHGLYRIVPKKEMIQ